MEDGNTSNPRNLTPADHVYGLHAIFKKHLASNTPIATGSNAQAKLSRDDMAISISRMKAVTIFTQLIQPI